MKHDVDGGVSTQRNFHLSVFLVVQSRLSRNREPLCQILTCTSRGKAEHTHGVYLRASKLLNDFERGSNRICACDVSRFFNISSHIRHGDGVSVLLNLTYVLCKCLLVLDYFCQFQHVDIGGAPIVVDAVVWAVTPPHSSRREFLH